MEGLRIVFENISGGMVMAGKSHGEMLFSRVSLEEYITYFQHYQPDILCLTEVHMEGKTGKSEMVETIASRLELPAYRCLYQSRSHLDTSKDMGIAVLSRYTIKDYTPFALPNPRLEVERPDGSHWKMLDKGAQRLRLDVHGRLITVFNLHYFPFHHFHRSICEQDFARIRRELVDILLTDQHTPTIITGDFNNKGISLRDAFPELFLCDRFREAVLADTTVVGLDEQFDHILYTPGTLLVKHGCADPNLSDHYAVIADFSFR